MKLLLIWALNAIALLTVANFVPGVHVSGFVDALVAALILGLVNALLRPLLIFLTLPITIFTFGLFLLVINGLMFLLVGSILNGFQVENLFYGILGAVLYSFVSWGLIALIEQFSKKK